MPTLELHVMVTVIVALIFTGVAVWLIWTADAPRRHGARSAETQRRFILARIKRRKVEIQAERRFRSGRN